MTLTRKGFFSSAVTAAAGALLAPKPSARADEGGTAPEIEGTWRFDNIPAPGGAIVSLQTFARGGVFLESAVLIGNTRAISRTTSQGVWEKIGPQLYLKTFEYFVQRAEGEEILRVKIREEVQVHGDILTILSTKITRHNLRDGSLHSEAPCTFPNVSGTRLPLEAPSCP